MNRRINGSRGSISCRDCGRNFLQRLPERSVREEFLNRFRIVLQPRGTHEKVFPSGDIRKSLHTGMHQVRDFFQPRVIQIFRGQIFPHILHVFLFRKLQNILRVQIREFLHIHLSGRTEGSVQRKRLHEFLPAQLFPAVAGRPAEQSKIIEEGLRQESFCPEISHKGIAVPLAVRFALLIHNHGKMCVGGDGIPEQMEKEQMLESIFHMIVTAHDMRDLLFDIVINVRKVENGASVCSDNDEILHAVNGFRHFPLDNILIKDFPALKPELCGMIHDHLVQRISCQFPVCVLAEIVKDIPRRIEDLKILVTCESLVVFHDLSLGGNRGKRDSGEVQGNCGIRSKRQLRLSAAADERKSIAMIREFENQGRFFRVGIKRISISVGKKFSCRRLVFFPLRRLVHWFLIVIHAQPFHALHQFIDGILS